VAQNGWRFWCLVDRLLPAFAAELCRYAASKAELNPMLFAFMIAQRLGYALGVVAAIFGAAGYRWWVIGLIVGTWWARGATSMALQKDARGEAKSWEVPLHIAIHLVALVSLYVLSILSFT